MLLKVSNKIKCELYEFHISNHNNGFTTFNGLEMNYSLVTFWTKFLNQLILIIGKNLKKIRCKHRNLELDLRFVYKKEISWNYRSLIFNSFIWLVFTSFQINKYEGNRLIVVGLRCLYTKIHKKICYFHSVTSLNFWESTLNLKINNVFKKFNNQLKFIKIIICFTSINFENAQLIRGKT